MPSLFRERDMSMNSVVRDLLGLQILGIFAVQFDFVIPVAQRFIRREFRQPLRLCFLTFSLGTLRLFGGLHFLRLFIRVREGDSRHVLVIG